MKKSREDEVYVRVKDLSGEEFVCPLRALKSPNELNPEELDNCVDSATVGRYSGNVIIDDPK